LVLFELGEVEVIRDEGVLERKCGGIYRLSRRVEASGSIEAL